MVTLRKRKAPVETSGSVATEQQPRKRLATTKQGKSASIGAPSKKSKNTQAARSSAKNEPVKTKGTKAQAKSGSKTSKDESKTAINSALDSEKSSQDMFYLMKAEPETRLEKGIDVRFSIDDLAAAKEPEPWDGVRNPAARNIMREMKKGDLAFFYHSNCKVPGIAGIMKVVREASPDLSAQDPKHPYYDPKDSPENPKWSVVHVEFVRKFDRLVSLKELQQYRAAGGELEDLQTFRQTRLSVSRVTPEQWDFILSLLDKES